MDCSLPGSSVHGIFQARVLEWGAIAFSAHPLVTTIKKIIIIIKTQKATGEETGTLVHCWWERETAQLLETVWWVSKN